jgi:hypothetical protein
MTRKRVMGVEYHVVDAESRTLAPMGEVFDALGEALKCFRALDPKLGPRLLGIVECGCTALALIERIAPASLLHRANWHRGWERLEACSAHDGTGAKRTFIPSGTIARDGKMWVAKPRSRDPARTCELRGHDWIEAAYPFALKPGDPRPIVARAERMCRRCQKREAIER